MLEGHTNATDIVRFLKIVSIVCRGGDHVTDRNYDILKQEEALQRATCLYQSLKRGSKVRNPSEFPEQLKSKGRHIKKDLNKTSS